MSPSPSSPCTRAAQIVVIVILVAITGCDSSATDERAIRQAYDSYQDALLRHDGVAAGAAVSRSTHDYFTEIAELTRTGSAAEIHSRPLIDRALILTQRMMVPVAEIPRLDGDDAFRRYVEAGGNLTGGVGSPSPSARYLSRIEIDDHRAHALEVVDGRLTPGKVPFVHEQGQWKFDLAPLISMGDEQLRILKKLEFSKVSDDVFLMEVLGRSLGKPIPSTIWQPPQLGD